MRKGLLYMSLIAGAFAMALSHPGQAEALEFEVGARAGGAWNLLMQPEDREGRPTLLHGSAFTGYGFVFGPTASMTFAQFAGARFSLGADLLYGYHQGSGFEAHPGGQRVDVTLVTHVLRLPVMVQMTHEGASLSPSVGLGVEPVFGLVSGATVVNTNIDRPAEPLETTPKSAMAGLIALGMSWDQGKVIVPVDLRFSWNPFVGSTTVERFDGYSSPTERGAYEVAFDWQIMATAGVRWGL